MNVYFSGAGGVAIGPLAMIAKQMGHRVSGSDQAHSPMVDQLQAAGVDIAVGEQNGDHLRASQQSAAIDYYVHSSAISSEHPELLIAQELGIKTIKRDSLIPILIEQNGLRVVAIAGTHGKTTTTAMLIWICQQLKTDVSYSVGSTISWGDSGHYSPGSEYFVYEADEYDRNFLGYHPTISLITSVDYDHPDIFATADDYDRAFLQFISQSEQTVIFDERFHKAYKGAVDQSTVIDPDDERLNQIKLAGLHNRQNALLAIEGAIKMGIGDFDELAQVASSFPGTGRRFEKLANNLYSDYAHTPEEIAVTIQMAQEIADGKKIVIIYEPHQNIRQQQIVSAGGYGGCFAGASQIIWLPTYLVREDPNLDVLSPKQLIDSLDPGQQAIASTAMADTQTAKSLIETSKTGDSLVIFVGAGPIHSWVTKEMESIDNES